MKLKNSNYDETKNSNCDKNQKLKLWGNSKKLNCEETQTQNSNCDETKKLKLK